MSKAKATLEYQEYIPQEKKEWKTSGTLLWEII